MRHLVSILAITGAVCTFIAGALLKPTSSYFLSYFYYTPFFVFHHDSRADMNKVDPSVYGDTPPPHRSSRMIKCRSRVSKIPTSSLFTKHVPIEILGNIWPINIRHGPQRPNYTAKAAELQSCSEVDGFIGGVINVDRCTMASRQEGQIGIWKSSLHQVDQCEPFIVVKLEI
jgi:hypothetical protein